MNAATGLIVRATTPATTPDAREPTATRAPPEPSVPPKSATGSRAARTVLPAMKTQDGGALATGRSSARRLELANDHTPKERVLRPDGDSGGHPERWTRSASTRSHMYRLSELHRERLRHAGAPELTDLPEAGRAEGISSGGRAQRTGGREVPDLQEYGQQAPSAGVSATGSRAEDSTPSGADSPLKKRTRR